MPEILGQRFARDLGDRTRHFDPGRAATDDDEIHCRGPRFRILGFLGKLEGHQNAPPNLDRVFQTLEAGSEFFPFVVPEIRMARAGRDDQIVVGNLVLCRPHAARLQIDRTDFGQKHLDVFVFAENTADRRCDVGRRKGCGRDLIEQRLKEMIVRAVDHRHPDRFVTEMLGRLQTAKAGADDHNARVGRFLRFHRQMIAGIDGR